MGSPEEDKLHTLLTAQDEQNRKNWALEAKRQGKKVIGILCHYVPEELIHAAGMFPWRVTGTWDSDVSQALVYRSVQSNLYCTHVLESLLRGEYNFLDGVVTTGLEVEFLRLLDGWRYLGKPPFSHALYVPAVTSHSGINYFKREIEKLKKALEDFSQKPITDEALKQSILVYNETRSLLSQLYALRKRDVPPLSGAEYLRLTLASTVMAKEDFVRQLKELMPYLSERKAKVKEVRPRLLVTSDQLDDPRFLQLIEDAGGLVAMDDLDTGSRYFWQEVSLDSSPITQTIAERYMWRPASPIICTWDRQAQQVIHWAQEYRCNGVLQLSMIYSNPRNMYAPILAKSLKEAGIPNMTLERDYRFGNVGQLKSRIEAFVEMLAA